jgi:uncharacterized protein (DUF58 family)
VTRFRSSRLLPHALIVSGGITLSLAVGRIEPLLIVTPFFVVLAAAALLSRSRVQVAARVSIDRDKALEGDYLEFVVHLANRTTTIEAAFVLDPPPGVEVVEQAPTVLIAGGSKATIRGRVRCRRWGIHQIGSGRVLARDIVSAFIYQQSVDSANTVRVYPRPERLRSLLRPHSLRPRFGSLVSRAAGAGLEFADIREFQPGDQRRHINWKATARQRRMHVNLFHPEWSSDIVLLLDSFTDVVGDAASSLDLSVRAATSAAIACIGRRDRVGLLVVGREIKWLSPGLGNRQLYQIVDSVMQTRLAFSYTWPTADAIPRRVIPAGALVLALTPLVDRRTPIILRDLLCRGHDVAVVEISAPAMLPPPMNQREDIARRLWALHREAVRLRLRQLGLPVAAWRPGQPFQMPLMELERFRRTSRRVRA